MKKQLTSEYEQVVVPDLEKWKSPFSETFRSVILAKICYIAQHCARVCLNLTDRLRPKRPYTIYVVGSKPQAYKTRPKGNVNNYQQN